MPDAFTLAVFATKLCVLAAALMSAGLGWAIALGGDLSRRVRSSVVAGSALAAALCYAVLLLTTNAQLGGAWASALDPMTFAWIWPGRQAQVLVLSLGLVAAVAASLAKLRLLGLTAAVLIGVSFSLSGHAAGLEDGLSAQIGVAIHGLAASFWFIAPLLLWPQGDGYDASVVRRFSEAAVWIVSMVFAAGGYLVWRLAGGLAELFTTAYGQLLTAKLAVALVALALGAVNKHLVSRILAADLPRGRRLLQITLGADAVLFLSALALVTWVTTVSGPAS
ncbi:MULTISPECIES: CopD family protein [Oceanicaulis]|uniref:CopD family protein n=1 Tax=Oceanicaulis TaxID=153232 RepID=UPI00235659A6|nr:MULTISPECIES: CopD family protein [Oceanicaulis]